MGLPLAVRMALGHSHFEAIHPFSDGNGRVGRMLLALQMSCSGKLPGLWLKRGTFRENSASARALTWLLSNPIFTAKQLSQELAVSPPAANRAIEQLRSRKIVRERTGRQSSRVFAAEEVIELLSRRFGDDPELALQRAQDLLSDTRDT